MLSVTDSQTENPSEVVTSNVPPTDDPENGSVEATITETIMVVEEVGMT